MTTGFFFMHRAWEYLVRPHVADSASKVIHGSDVRGRADNADVRSFKKAEELVVRSDLVDGEEAPQELVRASRRGLGLSALWNPPASALR